MIYHPFSLAASDSHRISRCSGRVELALGMVSGCSGRVELALSIVSGCSGRVELALSIVSGCSGRVELALSMVRFYYANPAQPATSLLWYSRNNDWSRATQHISINYCYKCEGCFGSKLKGLGFEA